MKAGRRAWVLAAVRKDDKPHGRGGAGDGYAISLLPLTRHDPAARGARRPADRRRSRWLRKRRRSVASFVHDL